ncbi:ribbon-helix-helix domain-containing protein [Lactobacillus helveticus]|uniref:Predicted DNA-binding protein ribbon-helix-helix domain-containing protein n=1 Tax=Lactobacillus helveticus TaxID=1587 RepID=A0A9Q5C0A1_LACHE|nr:ribbon-helix-helix domain-containing protein [Lactobacillus helveticus]NRN90939.1 hypothetical protein [Lactobacillus helveticus]
MKKRMTFTLDVDLLKELKAASEKTMIPQAKLVEKAIKQVLEQYNK